MKYQKALGDPATKSGKKAEIKDKDYNLSDGDGLYFIVRKNGSKFFRLDFRYGGK